MGVDDDSSEHPLRLHFAIIAYKEMVSNNDKRYAQLANDIYNKFLRPRFGLCAFIDIGIREQTGRKISQIYSGENPETVFNLCGPPLDTFLRKQHTLFVNSPEFWNFFNASTSEQEVNSSFIIKEPFMNLREMELRNSRKIDKSRLPINSSATKCEELETFGTPSKLTAHTLFHSQRDRETALGRRFVLFFIV